VISLRPFPGPLVSVVLTVLVIVLVFFLDPRGIWPLGLVNLAAFGLVLAVSWPFRHRDSAFSPATGNQFSATLLLGVLLSAWGGGIVVGELGNLVLRLWPMPAAWIAVLARLFDLSSPVKVLVPLMVIAPLTEEGLFRGLMLPALARRYGAATAVFWTSLLFALVHLNPWQGAGALVAGLYLGALRLRTGSVFWPMLAHCLFNGFPLLLSLAGFVVAGYNTPPSSAAGDPIPAALLLPAALALGLGLVLSFRGCFTRKLSDRLDE